MPYIAHIRKEDGGIQTVREHLIEVKELAESYGEKINVKHLSGLAGMLHDLGKYTNEFRDYILAAVQNPDAPPRKGSVDHSTAGGKFLYQLLHTENMVPSQALVAEVVGNAIISHHSYLQDFLSPNLESPFLLRVRDKKAKELEGFEEIKHLFYQEVISSEEFKQYIMNATTELEAYLSKDSSDSLENKLLFLSKYLFSTLIDADRTNTRLYEENSGGEEEVNHSELFETYYKRVLKKIESFSVDTPINQLRANMSLQCDQFAEKPSGIYTLSIPTGGGKTLASLRYALKHAIRHGKRQIIYVVPFTTIIEQNAAEIRNILQDDIHILEHHSNVIEDVEDDENEDGYASVNQRLKLAKDNWDSPIILTTMVQFLNVFYSKGNRNSRRLHNLAQSVIIFDEVQKVPVSCVSLFNQALNFLKTYAGCSILLCTATQPALDFVEYKLDIHKDAEIVQNLDDVVRSFKRVNMVDQATEEPFSTYQLASFIHEKQKEAQSILIILNTKTVVKALYETLKEKEPYIPIYHLSTSMCAAHRKQILTEIRQLLRDEQPVICISTQLIEAGVDVSFHCVIRSLSGLDSIAQAAGRCNRHGEKGIKDVYLIDHAEENLKFLKEIKVGKEITKKILLDMKKNSKSHGGDLLSRIAMDHYFHHYYSDPELSSKLNYFVPKLEKNMTDLLTETKRTYSYNDAYVSKHGKPVPLFLVNSYKTAADHFEVIDNVTTSVLVPYEEGKDLIATLSGEENIDDITKLLRTGQQYSVNVFQYELDKLSENQALISYFDGKLLAIKESAYSNEYGVNLNNDSPIDISIF